MKEKLLTTNKNNGKIKDSGKMRTKTMFKKRESAVDRNTEYLCIFGIRLIYRDGKYDGWYNPKLKRVL